MIHPGGVVDVESDTCRAESGSECRIGPHGRFGERSAPGSVACVSIQVPEEPDEPDIRASDAEREDVVQQLSEQASVGRLTLDELEERVGKAFAATTRGELAKLTQDLPEAASPPDRRRKPTRWVVSVMGGSDKKGRWRISDRLTSVALCGGNDIDLRHAEFDSDDVAIVAVAVMAGIDVYVPDTIDVEVGGFALMGGNSERGSVRAPRPGAPRVRVMAYSLMAGVDVWRLPEEARDLPLREAKKLARRAR
jgi:hypothetical protein